MAKKSKKAARRGRKPKPAGIPELNGPPVAREITIDSVMRDLSLIKATLSSLL